MYPVLCPYCAGRRRDCPLCRGQGLVLASQVTGMSGMGDFSLRKILDLACKNTIPVDKVIKQAFKGSGRQFVPTYAPRQAGGGRALSPEAVFSAAEGRFQLKLHEQIQHPDNFRIPSFPVDVGAPIRRDGRSAEELRSWIRSEIATARARGEQVKFHVQGSEVWPVYHKSMSGLDGTGMGDLGFSLSDLDPTKIAKKIAAEIGRSIKKVGAEASRFGSRTSAQLKRSKKHIVGGAAIATGIVLGATGVGLPVAGALIGAGTGMATKGGSNIGKFKEWIKPVGIGAGAGLTAGLAATYAPLLWTGGAAPSAAASAGGGVSAAEAVGAAGATGALPIAEVSPVAAAAAPAAAAASRGFSWGSRGPTLGTALKLGTTVLGAQGGGAAMPAGGVIASGGVPTGGSYPGIDAALAPSQDSYGGGYAPSGGGGGDTYVASGEDADSPLEEAQTAVADIVERAAKGQLTAREWAIYGGSALALVALGYAFYKRRRRRMASKKGVRS